MFQSKYAYLSKGYSNKLAVQEIMWRVIILSKNNGKGNFVETRMWNKKSSAITEKEHT